MLSVFQLGRFVSPFKIAGTRVIGGFRILRRSAKCTRRQNLKAARKKKNIGNLDIDISVGWNTYLHILFFRKTFSPETVLHNTAVTFSSSRRVFLLSDLNVPEIGHLYKKMSEVSYHLYAHAKMNQLKVSRYKWRNSGVTTVPKKPSLRRFSFHHWRNVGFFYWTCFWWSTRKLQQAPR